MAHQADVIDWHAIVLNMKFYSHKRSAKPPASNLYLQFEPDQEQHIDTFFESFSQAIELDTKKERQKYPKHYDPSPPDERIIDDDTAEKIIPSIARNNIVKFQYEHGNAKKFTAQSTAPFCQHGDEFNCECVLPLRERKARAFKRKYWPNHCYEFYEVNKDGLFNVDIVKALLLHGEMNLVLRICSIPGVHYAGWKTVAQCQCMESCLGWDRIYKIALDAYVVLNMLYSFAELYGRKGSKEGYRDTRAYQRLLRSCTRRAESDMCKHLHRRFFGIPDDHFTGYDISDWKKNKRVRLANSRRKDRVPLWNTSWDQWQLEWSRGQNSKHYPYGLLPLDVLLSPKGEVPFLFHEQEINEAIKALRYKGLPDELVFHILGFISPQEDQFRQLPVPHHPFHSKNRVELLKYLNDCWTLMVRCNMFAQELGTSINWKIELASCINSFFGGVEGKTIEWDYDDDDDDD